MTDTIIKNVNSDKYDLKQAKQVISKRLNKFYNNKLNKVLADLKELKKVDKSACRWGQCMIQDNKFILNIGIEYILQVQEHIKMNFIIYILMFLKKI